MGLLRRITPHNRLLAVVQWGLVILGFAALLWFVIFPWIDDYIPGAGMF